MNSRRGFTIMELLTVIAVLGILALIALPNLMEAQTRAKVARAKGELASLRTGLETYAIDYAVYPINSTGLGFAGDLYRLVGPTGSFNQIPNDIFADRVSWMTMSSGYYYLSAGLHPEVGKDAWGQYVLASAGPDRRLETRLDGTVIYDPTNGSLSRGDIVLGQKQGGRVER